MIKGISHCPLSADLISNRPRPFDVLRHLTPQTNVIDLQILIGIAFSHPFGPELHGCSKISWHVFLTPILRAIGTGGGQKGQLVPP